MLVFFFTDEIKVQEKHVRNAHRIKDDKLIQQREAKLEMMSFVESIRDVRTRKA